MTAKAPSIKKALWVSLILGVCLQVSALAADDSSATSSADSQNQQQQLLQQLQLLPPQQSDRNKGTDGGSNGAASDDSANDGSNGSSSSNPFGATFGNSFAGFFNPSAAGAVSGLSSAATASTTIGRTSLNSMADQYLQQYPEAKFLRDGDLRDANGNALPGIVNPTLVKGAMPFGSVLPLTPAAAMILPTQSRLEAEGIMAGLNQIGGFSGQQPSDYKTYLSQMVAGSFMARSMQYPPNVANQARAQAIGQSQAMTNAMGDMSKSQAASAIGYCSSFLQNFTTDDSNRWNKIRNGLFVPIAILLLLPGAVLTQVKAIMVQGNPVLNDPTKGDINPFEGILRAVIAIFLIPATYLVVNYGIDFSNSVVDSIASTYQTVMGSNMYQDALGAEVSAFPVRTPKQNQNAGAAREWPQGPITDPKTWDQNLIRNVDPITGLPIPGKTDEAMPAAAVAARQLSFGANAGLTAAWNILCAFQMAYLGYLFFVGPIAAALWVWPTLTLRAAFPAWVEGVITLCFWSLFWNTAILLMACFKGSDESMTMIATALNFLATASVKYAFDFAGLVKAAGQEAGSKAMADQGNGTNGNSGNKGKQGKSGADAAGRGAQPGPVGPMPGTTAAGLPSPALAPTALPSAFAPPQVPLPAPGAVATPEPPLPGATPAAYLPPLAVAPRTQSTAIRSESTALGNFTLSRRFNDQGQPVDVLVANGQDIATLPPDAAAPFTFDYGGQTYDVARANAGADTQFTLTNHGDGHVATAVVPPVNQIQPATNLGGTLTGNIATDSIALRGNAGTLLLENGGNTILLPTPDQRGYESFTLPPGQTEGTFTSEGRTVTVGHNPQNPNDRIVTLQTAAGTESFSIAANNAHGYNIGHTVNGQPAGSSYVSSDGTSTYYAKYGADGHLMDMDQITGNQILSTLYGENSMPIGSVTTTYDPSGNSEAMYYQPDGTLTASATHLFKPEGGFTDTVRNGAGVIVSVQDVGANQVPGAYNEGSVYPAPTLMRQEFSSAEYQNSAEYQSAATYQGDATSTYQGAPTYQGSVTYQESATYQDAAPMTVQAAALLHRDAQSVITHGDASAVPTPIVAPVSPVRARDAGPARISQPGSNMRTIASVLAGTAPRGASNNAFTTDVGASDSNAASFAPESVSRVDMQAQYAAAATAAQNAAFARAQVNDADKVSAADASNQNRSAVNSILLRMSNASNSNLTGAKENEITDLSRDKVAAVPAGANNIETNYQILNSLLKLGQIQQVRVMLPIIQKDLANQPETTQAKQLVNAYSTLLSQYNLVEEARCIQNTVFQLAVV